MLNKGPYVLDAIRVLDDILRRMDEAHQRKKTAFFEAAAGVALGLTLPDRVSRSKERAP